MPEFREIVVAYGPPWEDPARVSKHHLACYLSQRGRVLYLESPLHPFNLAARPGQAGALWRGTRRCRRITATLWVRRFFTPWPYHSATTLTASRLFNRLGQRWIAVQLRRQLVALGMTRPLLIAGLPHAIDLLPHVSWSGVVYHCADEYRSASGFPPTLPELERELVMAADVVVVTAEALLPERRALNQRTYWVPNGAEVEHFAAARAEQTPLAEELRDLPRPVVGFVGALAEWFDERLVAHAARALPDWSFVLVGPGRERVPALLWLPNVRVLGPRPYERLPGYLKGFDAAIIPFRDSELARKADPIKFYEYLAAGLPVVATDLPALRRFPGLVYLASQPPAFVEELKRAVEEDSPERVRQRQAEAARHGWTARFAELARLIEEAACAS